jgi:hypothetical protein
MVIKVISGGQTGVDRAALDVALQNEIACGGWCPKGRLADDGPIDAKYPVVESESSNPAQRTEANVRDSDGTLILSWSSLRGGTLKTAAVATRLRKPLLVVQMDKSPKLEEVEAWATRFNIRVLNVAGPKTSEVAVAYDEAFAFLTTLLVDTSEEPTE